MTALNFNEIIEIESDNYSIANQDNIECDISCILSYKYLRSSIAINI